LILSNAFLNLDHSRALLFIHILTVDVASLPSIISPILSPISPSITHSILYSAEYKIECVIDGEIGDKIGEIMEGKLATSTVNMWIKSKAREWSRLRNAFDRINASSVHQIDAIRSILSWEKAKINL